MRFGRFEAEPVIDKTEPPVELEFRDGKRHVPYYLAQYMLGWETYLMTYDDAIAQVNRRMEDDVVVPAMEGLIRDHFERFGG